MPTRRHLARLAIATALVASVPAITGAATYSNGTATATFQVTLTIIANCIIAANPLNFSSSQGVLATAVNTTTTLSVTCSNTTPYNLGLNAGTGTGSTIAARTLSSTTGGNSSVVAFNLFQTAGATNWGNSQGTDTVAGTGTGAAQTVTVYGQVPAQNTPQPDTYKSTITATVYF